MTDEEKLLELQRKALNLKYEAKALGGVEGAKKQLEYEQMLTGIQDIETSIASKAPARPSADLGPEYAVSSLARIGGGGNIGPSGFGRDQLLSESQKQTLILAQIRDEARRDKTTKPILMR